MQHQNSNPGPANREILEDTVLTTASYIGAVRPSNQKAIIGKNFWESGKESFFSPVLPITDNKILSELLKRSCKDFANRVHNVRDLKVMSH